MGTGTLIVSVIEYWAAGMTLVEYKDLKLKLNRKVDFLVDLKMGLQV